MSRVLTTAAQRLASVVVEKPSETLTTADRAVAISGRRAEDEFVPKALVIPFAVIVLDEFVQCSPKVTLAQRNHAVETFVLDRAHEALGVGIRIGRLERGQHDANPGLFELPSDRRISLPVTIADQHAMAHQHTLVRRRERTTDLTHEHLVGMWCRANNLHSTRGQVDHKGQPTRAARRNRADATSTTAGVYITGRGSDPRGRSAELWNTTASETRQSSDVLQPGENTRS